MPGAETALFLLPSLVFRGATPERSVDLTGGRSARRAPDQAPRASMHRAQLRPTCNDRLCPDSGPLGRLGFQTGFPTGFKPCGARHPSMRESAAVPVERAAVDNY